MIEDLTRREFINMVEISAIATMTMAYLPHTNYESSSKGLAMAHPEYPDLSGMEWFYDWGSSHYLDPRYVPMSYAGEDPNLPPDYAGYCLLFNEPNNVPPYGANITPQDGAAIYLRLRQQYPNAKWVVGNVSIWAWDWLVNFHNLVNDRPIRGIHGYVEEWITTQYIIDNITEAHRVLGGSFWVTEWADTTGDISNDTILRKFFENTPWIERHAYFTNRAKGDEPWYPKGWNVQLFDWDTGELTRIGKWYAGELHEIFMPVVMA